MSDTQLFDNKEIIIFPDFREMKEEVERLRTELSMLVLERDELKFVICKNIEMEYMLKLGSLEYKAYEAQCASLRLKRKIELIQARLNRQEAVNLPKIDERLDKEFIRYQQELNKQIDKMNEALSYKDGEFLSEYDNKALKKLYRRIVKVLHPDINPEVTKSQMQLMENAIMAYKNGDLQTLRIIDEMVSEHQLPEQHKDAFSLLIEERDRLNSMIEDVKKSINTIKSEYPYNLKNILMGEEKVEQRKVELEGLLEQYKELIEVYNTMIEEMLR